MIEKLLRLRGIGVFSDGLPKGAIQLAQCTVVYGENGRGKTTLSHLLRSLCTGDCDRLKPRSTIDEAGSPSAELLISGSRHVLKGYTWTPPRARIAIFDAEFVSRNVHSGSGVTPEHRKNLCEFVLGEEAVGLAKDVENLNEGIKRTTAAVTTAESGLRLAIGNTMSLDQFLTLPADPDIDAKLAEAQKLLDAAADHDTVLEHPGLVCVEVPPVPTHDDMGVLAETIEGLSAHAVERVRQHIREHLDDSGEVWLKTGLEYLTDDRCPFCGQAIGGSDVLGAFRGYFGEAYEALVARVRTQANAVRTAYAESGLSDLRAAVSGNTAAREYWSRYTTVPPLSLNESDVGAVWQHVRESLLPEFDRKLADPSHAVVFEGPLGQVVASHASATAIVAAYNEQVDQINAAVAACKRKLSACGAETHAAAIARLRLQQRRWEGTTVSQCESLQQLRKRKSDQEAAKDEAKKLLDKHLRGFSTEYRAALNGFLMKCNAPFRIEGIKAAFAGGEARSDYSIGLFGHSLNASTKPGDSPHFDTALSEGDKRTLAFAFFLARLERDPKLATSIVVLDDPVASLDSHRRRCTIEAIVDVATRCGQLIVMTHDPGFFADATKALRRAGRAKGGGLVTLGIRRSGKRSVICECDPSEVDQIAYQASVEDLHSFAADTSSVPALGAVRSIRPSIEGLLRIKYPLELKEQRQLGKMIEAIRDCEASSRLSQAKHHVAELFAVEGYATDYMHLDDPCSLEVPQVEEALGYVRRALTLLDEL